MTATPWRPDSAAVGSPVYADVTNAYWEAHAWLPVLGPTPYAAALSASPQGTAALLADDGSVVVFAGTATALYKLANANWADVTRTSGGAYTGGTSRWHYATFGTLALATNAVDVIQKYEIGVSSDFAALGGTPPVAKFLTVIGDFVVAANLSGFPRRLHWCGLNAPEFWTIGSQSCDIQDLGSGGPITGVVAGIDGTGYIFQKSIIRQMVFQPSGPLIFQIDEIETQRGCIAPDSLVQVGKMVFFLSSDGFFQFSPGGSMPIGAKKIDKWFFANALPGQIENVIGTADPNAQRVYWAFTSIDNTTATGLDKMLVYDWVGQEWYKIEFDAAVADLMRLVTPGYTLEDLDVFGDLDSLPFSLDDPIWSDGSSRIAVIGTDGVLSLLAGDALQATFTTADAMPMGRKRTYVAEVFPQTDAVRVLVECGVRERLSDRIDWTTPNSLETYGGVPIDVSGRIVRFKTTIPAASAWTTYEGLQPTWMEDGGI